MQVTGIPTATFNFYAFDNAELGGSGIYLPASQLDNLDEAAPPEDTNWEIDLSPLGDGHWFLAYGVLTNGGQAEAPPVAYGEIDVPSSTPLTARQLRWLHDELGASAATDAELQSRYDDLASVRDVALAVLRDQRSELLDSPLSVSVAGVASINTSENVKAIERRLTALSKLDDDPTSTPGEDADGGTGVLDAPFRLTRARGR